MTSPINDEKQLIRRVLDGKTEAFGILVERYRDTGYSVIYSVIKNRVETEDCLQEAFIKAFRSLSSFRADASFSTWFFRICMNTAFSSQRGLKMKIALSLDESHEVESDEDEGVLPQIEYREKQQLIREILGDLKEEEALLLRLYYLAEKSVSEIEEITSFSGSKVKVGLHRARKEFKRKLLIREPH